MPMVLFTSALQRFLPVPSALVTGATIAEALAAVFASEPRLRGYVLDDQGALRRHVTRSTFFRRCPEANGRRG